MLRQLLKKRGKLFNIFVRSLFGNSKSATSAGGYGLHTAADSSQAALLPLLGP